SGSGPLVQIGNAVLDQLLERLVLGGIRVIGFDGDGVETVRQLVVRVDVARKLYQGRHGLGLERGGLKRPCELRADNGIAADDQHGAEAEPRAALENVAARQRLFLPAGKT